MTGEILAALTGGAAVVYMALFGQRSIAEAIRERRQAKASPDAKRHGVETATSVEEPLIYENLPNPDYGVFLGRQQEISTILNVLLPYPKSQYPVVIIDGVGGVGKSSLALSISHHYVVNRNSIQSDDRFDAVIWTSAKIEYLTSEGIINRHDTAKTLEDIYRVISTTLNRQEILRASVEEQVGLVKKALKQQRTLLIIDNLETIDDERVYSFIRELPAPTKALITTRNRIDVAFPVRLTGLPKNEAMELLRQECEKKRVTLTPEQTEKLYERTGGIPLAIVWSIGQIGLGHSVQTVLARLGNSQGDVAKYCFERIIQQIKERDSYTFLLACASLPSAATRETLFATAGFEEDVFSAEDALVELERLSLITRHNYLWNLLPLARQYTIELCGNQHLHSFLERATKHYVTVAIREVGDERMRSAGRLNYDALDAERDNIFALIEWAYTSESWNLLVDLVKGLGYFPHARGYWQEAIRYWEIGANVSRLLGRMDEYARFTTYLGFMTYFQGNYPQAEAYAQRALEVVKDTLPSYQRASILRLFGYLAEAENDSNRALHYFGESLTMMRQVKNTHGICRLLNDLCEITMNIGEIGKAHGYVDEALAISEAYGDSTERVRCLRHLGVLASKSGNYQSATKYLNESHDLALQIGWQDEVAHARQEEAKIAFKRGDKLIAKDLAREALDIYERLGEKIKSDALRRLVTRWQ